MCLQILHQVPKRKPKINLQPTPSFKYHIRLSASINNINRKPLFLPTILEDALTNSRGKGKNKQSKLGELTAQNSHNK